MAKQKSLLEKLLESETLHDKVRYIHPDKKRFLFEGIGPYMNTRYEIYDRDSLCVDGYSMRVWFSELGKAYEWWVRYFNSPDMDEWNKAERERNRLLYEKMVQEGKINEGELPWF